MSLSELCERAILEKKGKNYKINISWVNKIKNFGEKVEKLYSSKNVIKDFEKDDIINLSFSRFVDFGKFIINVFHGEFPNPEKNACVCFLDHVWGPMGLDEEDVKQLEKVYHRNKHFGFFKQDSPLDQYFADGMQVLGKVCFLGVELPVQGDILIEGDYICQVFYSPEFKKKFDTLYENIPKVGQGDFISFFKLYQEPHTIQAVITKNPRLANYLRKWVTDFEEKEGKKKI
ncbi:hypothetical protein KKE06_03105 [Candidatus Micrarchaeota archaeon]|nr:hypothetical protein [Candidatus Micrarchaeota archaeon]MBU1930977.1 hypothetical protein [Candidatus Micrarchaeota archaeon]